MKKENTIAAGLLFLSIVALWVYKIPYLSLPFFGDEAFSYARAFWAMYQNHPCLLPGCILPDLYRGHPLLFYFMAAAVAKIFGFSPLVLHVFALILSSIFLVVFFSILLRFTNPVFALLGTMLLLLQEVFIVQSSFMLPEIFMSMLTFVAGFCWITGRNFIYLLSATLLVLSKESGLIIVAAISLVALIFLIKEKKWNEWKKFSFLIKHFFLLAFPLLIGIAFYVYQKIVCGWYFFPEHIQLINFNWDTIFQHWIVIRGFVFTGYGRRHLVWLSGLIIILLLIYWRRSKTQVPNEVLKITWLLLMVFTFYFFFSVVNWILLRYLTPLIAIYIFLMLLWSHRLHQYGFRIFPYLYCVAIGISLYHDFTFNPTWIDDVSINYMDNVAIDQQTVTFMENNDAYSKKIFTTFLIEYNLTSSELFYLHGAPFKNVHSDELLKDADYYIFSNVLFVDAYYNYAKSNDSLQLIKRFDKGNAWSEIYERKKK